MQLVRNKKTNEVGKLVQKQQKYFTVLIEWKDKISYHRQDDIEYIENKGANGVD